jgi:hypothetical protein
MSWWGALQASRFEEKPSKHASLPWSCDPKLMEHMGDASEQHANFCLNVQMILGRSQMQAKVQV